MIAPPPQASHSGRFQWRTPCVCVCQSETRPVPVCLGTSGVSRQYFLFWGATHVPMLSLLPLPPPYYLPSHLPLPPPTTLTVFLICCVFINSPLDMPGQCPHWCAHIRMPIGVLALEMLLLQVHRLWRS